MKGAPVKPPARRARTLIALMALLCVALTLLAPSAASAHFTRQFLHQITGTCKNAGESPPKCEGFTPFSSLNGVAVEPAEVPGQQEDNVLIPSGFPSTLQAFSPAYEVKPPEAANRFEGSLKPGAGSFAIEHATGKVYRGSGQPEDGQYVAVDDSTDLVADPSACAPGCVHYVSTSEVMPQGGVEKLGAGEEPLAFTGSAEYIGGKNHNKIIGFPPGLPAGCAPTEEAVIPTAVAVDARGDIYVVAAKGALAGECDSVLEFAASGLFVRAFDLHSAEVADSGAIIGVGVGVAVDPVSGHLLVSLETNAEGERGAVDEFVTEGAGGLVTQFAGTLGGGRLARPRGVAVDSRGDVYVVDRPRQGPEVVDVFGPGLFLPTVVAGVVGERRAHSALLSGSVNPEGRKLSECEFQFVSEEAFAKEGFAKPGVAECEPAAGTIPVSGTTAVEGQAVGLSVGVTYRYRLLAHSEGALGGTATSTPLAFTVPAPAKIGAESAQGVSSSFAELRAGISPLGADTSYFFEYGPTSSYGLDAPVLSEAQPDGVDVGPGGPAGDALETVAQPVAGLAAGSE